jgi:hypothetical protein
MECFVGSFSDLVQLVLQGIDLPFKLLEGLALRRDEQAPVLAPGVALASLWLRFPTCSEPLPDR